MPIYSEADEMTEMTPVVDADRIFAINNRVRWVGLVTAKGEVVLNQMRPGVQSYSPSELDAEFLRLGPLTLLGVEERYSQYMQGVMEIVVYYGLTVSVYARLGSQVIAISIEDDRNALSEVRAWLKIGRSEFL